MLTTREDGPVRYFSLARSWAGRSIMTSGVYFVDGTLIDAGPTNAQVDFAAILGQVDAEQLVLTHHHEDHTGNAVFASNHLDRLPLAHGLALPLVRNPKPLPVYRRVAWGDPGGFEAEALGKVLHTREHAFNVIHTPGHSPDHIALHEPERRWLFVGDLYISPRLEVLRDDEDITASIRSMRKLLELPDCALFCQHSGPHKSHQKCLGSKLDFLLGLQGRATVLHDEGCSPTEIARRLKIEKPVTKLFSRGEFSAVNLITALLHDAGINNGDG